MERFQQPSWTAPFDQVRALAAIPENATISGMFPQAVVAGAEKRGLTLASARDKYVPFKFYPLREHAQLLLEAADLFHPGVPLRQALRLMGQHAPRALLSSTVGKVMLGSVAGAHEVIHAMTKAYPINLKPSYVVMTETTSHSAVVRLQDVYSFVDCHHVGTFEGVLTLAGVKGEVLIHSLNPSSAELSLRWE